MLGQGQAPKQDLKFSCLGGGLRGKRKDLGDEVRRQSWRANCHLLEATNSIVPKRILFFLFFFFFQCVSWLSHYQSYMQELQEKYVLTSWNWIIKWGLTWCWLFFMADLQYKLGLRHLLLNLLDFSRSHWMSHSLKISCWCYLFRLWCPFSVFPPLSFNNDIFQAENTFHPVVLRAFHDGEPGPMASG